LYSVQPIEIIADLSKVDSGMKYFDLLAILKAGVMDRFFILWPLVIAAHI
jgi:hypothetical protein